MTSSDTKQAGQRIGEWELLDPIGEGGAGHVWRARGPGGVGALKVIAPELAEVDEVRGRFLREVKTLRRVVHPNVVRFLDAGEVDGELFLVMELLDGEPLETRLATVGRLPPEVVIQLGCELADGLAAVHAAGIVHRDIKPTNILLCAGDQAKLIDFGIAKWTDAHMDLTQMTRTGRVMGTPSYMAPEQADALREESERTDVWGLAATLYDAVCGHPPFGADDPPIMALLARILSEPPRPLPDDVPVDLAAVILQGLERDPDHRFQSMVAFSRALRSGAAPASSPARRHGVEVRLMSIVLMRSESEHEAGRAMQEIQREGGDGFALPANVVLGIFGGGEWLGDEPERAARAALAARPFVVAAGVATGRGTWPPAEGQLSGDVMEAARAALEAVRARRGIQLCADTEARIAGLFEVDGSRGLVGRSHMSSTLRTRGMSGALVPLLSRKREMRELGAALTAAVGLGEATFICIEGEPGMGKSRMLTELRVWADQRLGAARYLEARAEPARRLSSLALVRTLLKAASGVRPAMPSIRAQLDALVSDVVADDDETTRLFLGELMGEQREDPRLELARADRRVLYDGLHAAVRSLMEVWCRQRPVVVLIDDLQFVDSASLDLIEHLLGALTELPFVVLATSRPDAPWARRRPHLEAGKRVLLSSLDEAAVGRMTEVLLGDVSEDVVAGIVERSGGNPHFVEELAMASLERAVAVGLPLSVEASVQARLDALPPEEKEVLKRAALLGRSFWVEALEALGVDVPRSRLGALARRGFVTPAPSHTLRGGGQWWFCHDVVVEVAQGMLSADQRRELHRLAAAWLSAQTAVAPATLAHHLEHAGARQRAAAQWLRVAETSAQRHDYDGVLGATSRGLFAQGEAPIEPVVEGRLRLLRAEGLQAVGRAEAYERELDVLEELDASLPTSDRVRLRWRRGEQLASLDTERAAAKLQEGVAIADAGDHADMKIDARARLTFFLGRVDTQRAAAVLAEAEALSGPETNPLTRSQLLYAAAFVANYRGETVRALRAWQGQLAELERAGVRDGRLAGALVNIGYALRVLGAHGASARAVERASSLAAAASDGRRQSWALHNLGLALALGGEHERGMRLEQRAEAFALATGDASLGIAARLYAGVIANLMGDGAAALEKLEMALAEARALDRATVQASCNIQRAIALNLLGRAEEALAATASALHIREAEGGSPEFELDLWLARHDALLALGRPDEARETVRVAMRSLEARRATLDDAELRRAFEAQPTVRRLHELGVGLSGA